MYTLRMSAQAALIVIAIVKIGVPDAMMAFILTGAIPGTLTNIPSDIMILATITGLWLYFLSVAVPFLVRRHALEISTYEVSPAPAVSTMYKSSEPSFRLFSPVVHISR